MTTRKTKKSTESHSVPMILISLGFLLTISLVTGCATVDITESKDALVCPQCQTAWIDPAVGESEPYFAESFASAHPCINCKGAISTLLQRNSLKHTCSKCKQEPYSCKLHAI